MSITRRQFLLGTAGGLVLPSFFERAYSYAENHGEPLLIIPKKPTEILYACSEFAFVGYELNLGDPYNEPPDMSVREFCTLFGEGDPERWWREFWLGDSEDMSPVDLDAPMDRFTVLDWWCLKHSSNARAYHYLKGLDLGPQLSGARPVGELAFTCGAAPGCDYMGVEAADEVTLSLLQQRLNELRTGIEVRMH